MNLKMLNIVLALVLAVLIGVWIFLLVNFSSMRPPDIRNELKLDKSQMQELDSIRKTTMSEQKDTMHRIRDLNKKLKDELSKPELNNAAISILGSDIQREHKRIAELQMSAIINTRKILGADNFKRMTDLFEHKIKERREGLPMMDPRRPGPPDKEVPPGPPPEMGL